MPERPRPFLDLRIGNLHVTLQHAPRCMAMIGGALACTVASFLSLHR